MLLILTYTSTISVGHFYDLGMKKIYREMNYYHAYTCIDQAILFLSQDYFFLVSEPMVLPELKCSIISIENKNGIHSIKTVGNYMNANVYRSALVKMNDQNLEIVGIE